MVISLELANQIIKHTPKIAGTVCKDGWENKV